MGGLPGLLGHGSVDEPERMAAHSMGLICAELWLRQFVDQRSAMPEPSCIWMARPPMSVPASASASHPAPSP